MHDIKRIRSNPDSFDGALKTRGEPPIAARILAMDQERRAAIHALEEARAAHKRASDAIAKARAADDKAAFGHLRDALSQGREHIRTLEATAGRLDKALRTELEGLPNQPLDSVPVGSDEADNMVLRTWGSPPEFSFAPREHHEIAGVQGGLDFRTAAQLSGSRFCLLTGAIARLHRALGQFMLDVQIGENGLEEVWTPILVKPEIMYGTGQLPKFADESYQTENGKWLLPTAEVALTNLVRESVVDAGSLPRRYCALTQCFRSEAGAAGKDTAGMLRQHQFEKVEMVSVTTPEASEAEHQRMLHCAEGILERLEIPYRTIILCTGDMGFGAAKTWDIEAWLPGQGAYREISSVSNCCDFQARRMNARYVPEGGGSPQFVHTLNGSGLAVGRKLIAVLENGQNGDGSIGLPTALKPYLGGMDTITAAGQLVLG